MAIEPGLIVRMGFSLAGEPRGLKATSILKYIDDGLYLDSRNKKQK